MLDQAWQERDYAASLLAFWGAEAARRQGKKPFERFHLALLRARHRDNLSLAQPETVLQAAESAELYMKEFQESLHDPSCLERLASDHKQAIGLGVFGTPTFACEAAEPTYLKLSQIPDPDEAVEFWKEFRRMVTGMAYVQEIKRPH